MDERFKIIHRPETGRRQNGMTRDGRVRSVGRGRSRRCGGRDFLDGDRAFQRLLGVLGGCTGSIDRAFGGIFGGGGGFAGSFGCVIRHFGSGVSGSLGSIGGGGTGSFRGVFGGGQAGCACKPRTAAQEPPHEPPMPDLRDDPLIHDPLDGPDAQDRPSDQNPRLHRL